ncbi:MAG: RNA 3'-terminal phosphate cyclase [Candidatus Methanocomedens sp.]|nr:MAG: RNA 3'-terminal phosphate cyclase [ANME-2 cluster archaeon]
MITIDGSYGEGGGQIIRTAVALSAVYGEDVTIHNIRSARPKPGLKAQHLMAVRTAAKMTGAQVEGLKIGSTELTFKPQDIIGGHYDVNIGTAGSITLLLQCLMPAAAASKEPITLDIIGGTDVAWSPSVDYMSNVLLPVLASMGLECSIKVNQRGYYPKGGGQVRAEITPSVLVGAELKQEQGQGQEQKMEPKVEQEKKHETITGISHSSNLPEHVTRRQADSALAVLEAAGYGASIDTEYSRCLSTGSGITLWSGYMGGSALGKRGLPAEKVGQAAAGKIIAELGTGAAVDVHLADQLIPYMGLAGSGSFTVREVSEHTNTNIWVVEQFLDVEFGIEKQEGGLFRIYL